MTSPQQNMILGVCMIFQAKPDLPANAIVQCYHCLTFISAFASILQLIAVKSNSCMF